MLAPQKTAAGWVLEIPPEMASTLHVDPKSIILLYPREGALDTEILSPPSNELEADFERLFDKYQRTFEELKRISN